MSSPFSDRHENLKPSKSSWEDGDVPTSQFVAYNPFGIFNIDLGYGSGGYGDLPYGENLFKVISVHTSWSSPELTSYLFSSSGNSPLIVWDEVVSR